MVVSNLSENHGQAELTIGVLDLQGGVFEHLDHLKRIGIFGRPIKIPDDVLNLAGLIIPGGETDAIRRIELTPAARWGAAGVRSGYARTARAERAQALQAAQAHGDHPGVYARRLRRRGDAIDKGGAPQRPHHPLANQRPARALPVVDCRLSSTGARAGILSPRSMDR